MTRGSPTTLPSGFISQCRATTGTSLPPPVPGGRQQPLSCDLSIPFKRSCSRADSTVSVPVAVPASLPVAVALALEPDGLLALLLRVLVEQRLRRRIVGRLVEQGRNLARIEFLLCGLGFLLGLLLLLLLQLFGALLLALLFFGFLLLPPSLGLFFGLLGFVGLALVLEFLLEQLLVVGRRAGSRLRRRRWRRLVDLLCDRVGRGLWRLVGLRRLSGLRRLGGGRLELRDLLLGRRRRRRRVIRLCRIVLAVVGLRLVLGFRFEVLGVLAALLQAQELRRRDDVGGDCRRIGASTAAPYAWKKAPTRGARREKRGTERARRARL